ncbi:MAG: diguanylate cyclase [Campylobacterales bacterium]|nr:diguanylate cyclase [Campylobacterales bacterium]
MSIEQIAAKTIRALKANNLSLTPENYTKVFCHEARNSGSKIDDCFKLEKHFEKLSEENKKLANNYNITTIDEFIVFLTATLNRTGDLKNDDFFHAAVLLCKQLLKYLSTFPDKNVRSLAEEGLKLEFKNYQRVMEQRTKWLDLISSNNFDYLNKLDKYGYFDKEDLHNLIEEVIINLEKDSDVKAVSNLISDLLEEIAQEDGAPVKDLINELKDNPKIITSNSIVHEVKDHFEAYFKIKHKVLKKSSIDFKDAIDFYTEKTSAFKDSMESHKNKLLNFKDEISSINPTGVFSRIFGITEGIEKSVDEIGSSINQSELEIIKLRKKVEDLEASLSLEKRRNDTDLLTTLFTRRKILSFASNYEESFKLQKKDYTVVFLKPNNFEQVAEEFGRFASDTVLSSIGKFLKAKVADIGQIGRYNGNIFLVLSQLNEDIVLKHLQDLKHKVEKSKFMYEEKRVEITISYGIGKRKDFISQKDIFNRVFEAMR